MVRQQSPHLTPNSQYELVYMAFYYYSLWDRQKVTMRILACALVTTYVPAYVLFVCVPSDKCVRRTQGNYEGTRTDHWHTNHRLQV